VSVGALAYCYADAGRNRQFVFNMRDAPASWVDAYSPEHFHVAGWYPGRSPGGNSSVTQLATMHCLHLHLILRERQFNTESQYYKQRRSTVLTVTA